METQSHQAGGRDLVILPGHGKYKFDSIRLFRDLNPLPPTPSVSNPTITLLQKSEASAPNSIVLTKFDCSSASGRL